jgi:hypothetical protein
MMVVEIGCGQRKVAVLFIASRARIEAQIVATLLGGLGEDVEQSQYSTPRKGFPN